MRIPNDILLAREVDGIDLILGGHDHHKFNEFVNGKWIIKSGTDFKSLSLFIFLDIDAFNHYFIA